MKIIYILVSSVLIILLHFLNPGNVGAISFGVYNKDELNIQYYNLEWSGSYVGFGFVLDTALAKDELINYRINVGFDPVFYKGSTKHKLNQYKIYASNAFGFRLYQSKHVRIWSGPELALSYLYFKKHFDLYEYADIITYNSYERLQGLMVQIGGVVGFNFNLGDLITLGLEFGTNILDIGVGRYRKKKISIYKFGIASKPYIPDIHRSTNTVSLGADLNIKLSILFRFNDKS